MELNVTKLADTSKEEKEFRKVDLTVKVCMHILRNEGYLHKAYNTANVKRANLEPYLKSQLQAANELIVQCMQILRNEGYLHEEYGNIRKRQVSLKNTLGIQ